MKECKPISKIVGLEEASYFGSRMEAGIRYDYCQSKGGCEWFPEYNMDFADRSEGFTNVDLFISYLHVNNPHITYNRLFEEWNRRVPGLRRARAVPDLVTHAFGRREFYEIKPNSTNGRKQGRSKIRWLEHFFARAGLPYRTGKLYDVDKTITIHRSIGGTVEIETTIHFFLKEEALILYEVCTDVKVRTEVIEEVVLAVVTAAAVAAAAFFVPAVLPQVVPAM